MKLAIVTILLGISSTAIGSEELDEALQKRSSSLDYELDERWNPNCEAFCRGVLDDCLDQVRTLNQQHDDYLARWHEFIQNVLGPIKHNYLCKFHKSYSRSYPEGIRWPTETVVWYRSTIIHLHGTRAFAKCSKTKPTGFGVNSCEACQRDLNNCLSVKNRMQKVLKRAKAKERRQWSDEKESFRNEFACEVQSLIELMPEGKKTLMFIFRDEEDRRISNQNACRKVKKNVKKAIADAKAWVERRREEP